MVEFPRLREALFAESVDPAAGADFEIAFRRDGAGRGVVVGRVRAVLPLQCQRCLGTLEHEVDASVSLMLVSDADAVRDLPEPYDALPVMDGWVVPAEMIEDELLLSLPQIPMHGVGACVAGASEAPHVSVPSERRNPFEVLAGLKTEF